MDELEAALRWTGSGRRYPFQQSVLQAVQWLGIMNLQLQEENLAGFISSVAREGSSRPAALVCILFRGWVTSYFARNADAVAVGVGVGVGIGNHQRPEVRTFV